MTTLEKLDANLTKDKPKSFEDCLAWARLLWQILNQSKELTVQFPAASTSMHSTCTAR
ncbi:unnamed protein product [Echinostoma caproni]|uniref:UBA_e1_thiolCys domain-containing protein n=1 Tax=Echinostoma caproni TaxID=27848 RepID=A0A183ABK0_9TREM|nr:unnamed protein product [Echinostoma caproni]